MVVGRVVVLDLVEHSGHYDESADMYHHHIHPDQDNSEKIGPKRLQDTLPEGE